MPRDQNISNLSFLLSRFPRPSPTVVLALDYSLLLLKQYFVRHEYQDCGNNIDDCERCNVDELQDLKLTRETIIYFAQSEKHAEIASRHLVFLASVLIVRRPRFLSDGGVRFGVLMIGQHESASILFH